MNKYEAVLNFINTCPLAGADGYFNFIDETNSGGNTSLMTGAYPTPYRTYVDGGKLFRMLFEIKQVKPYSQQSNSSENAEQFDRVQQFLNWINEQGENGNYPQFEGATVVGMECTSDMPLINGVNQNAALYSFPFEIYYKEEF